MAENPESVEIALHSALAELYAFCTPAEGMTALGEAAMERAWEILCLDKPALERARELEKAEKRMHRLETAIRRVLVRTSTDSHCKHILKTALKVDDERA